MPRIAKELAAIEISRLTTAGTHTAGSNLYLDVKKSGARAWIFRATIGKKRRSIGLGAYPAIPLKEAREKARQAREMIEQGIDPIEQKKAARSAILAKQAQEITFKECACLS